MKIETSVRLHRGVVIAALMALAFSSPNNISSSVGQELSLPDKFGELASGGDENVPAVEKVQLTAEFKLKTDSKLGLLSVHAEIGPNQMVYSVTQKKGGPVRTTIAVTESDQFEVYGDFTPDAPPHVETDSEAFDVPVEHHVDSVIWTAPIRIADGVDPKLLKLELIYNGQVCQTNEAGEVTGCDQIKNRKLAAAFAGYDEALKVSPPPVNSPPAEIKPFKPQDSQVTFTGKVTRADGGNRIVSPGDKISLQITAQPAPEYHIYAYEHQKSGETLSTIFGFTNDAGWNILKPNPSPPPFKHEDPPYLAHSEPVTWTFDINIPEDAEKKNYTLNGLIGFQTCTDQSCTPPDGAKFSVVIPVGIGKPPFPVKFEAGADYGDVEAVIKSSIGQKGLVDPAASPHSGINRSFDSPAQIAEMETYYDPKQKINYLKLKESKETSFWSAIGLIFVGGILLNLMPCVFPVLGLKVMGFVEQAGSDAKKIRIHGIVFTLGLVFSMWVLAGIVLTLKLVFGHNVTWGAEQMGNPYFVGAIVILLFVMGLNMAGVFEMGIVLTRVGTGTKTKKGYSASFLAGILTTLIATPCSGPFLGTAMGYTLSQPAEIAMLLFTVFALGIAFPYVVLSFFPGLINRLPRPGAWMHTFKILMAFALFATVAFFLQTFGGQTGVDGLSWMVMAMVVIGLAAFFYGTWSPAYVKPFKRIWFGWVLPVLIAMLGLWMGYDAAQYKNPAHSIHTAGGLDWQPWHPGKIEYMLDKKPSIVWVDYTADW